MKIDLNGKWLMKKTTDDVFLPANVPGSVFSDLKLEGILPDPFWRDNENEYVAMAENDFIYARTFSVSDETLNSEIIELVCEGIDTNATIFINDIKVDYVDDMHRTWVFNVASFLKAGENTIRIEFVSPLKIAREMFEKIPNSFTSCCTNGFTGVRKAHSMYGWDWGGRFSDIGIWRNIYISAFSGAKFDSVYVRQTHSENCVELAVDYELKNNTDTNFEIEIIVTSPNGTVYKQNSDGKIIIENPSLWWPNGYGEQPLYNIIVNLKKGGQIIDEWEKRIGLRTITVTQNKDEWGESFSHNINGIDIFGMGANYIPEDIMLTHCNEQRTRKLLTDLVSCNGNVIRVWGGAYFPEDFFFDICDELGLIVWQDFMFACGFYNLTEEFEDNIVSEMADNIKRIRHHASLGLWCGNNEIETFACNGWNDPTPAQKSDYLTIMEYIIPKMLKKLDPQTFYWPSSPSSGGAFDKPNDHDTGDCHYWTIWFGQSFYTEYRKLHFRYLSEFGCQGMPNERTIDSFTLPSDRNLFSYIMEKHQRSNIGSYRIADNVFKILPMPYNFSDMVYASQLTQGESLKYCIEHLRRNRGRCMGALYWQLNDCWPVISWATIDYYGRWKAAQYYSKRFFAPVLLSADAETQLTQELDINAQPYDMKKTAIFNISNETRSTFNGKIKWLLCDNVGNVLREGEYAVSVDPLSVFETEKVDFKDADIFKNFVKYELHDNSDKMISSETIMLCAPKYFNFSEPEISVSINGDGINITCKGFAKNVEIITDDADALLSDNYFDLVNESRTISVVRGTVKSVKIRSVIDIGK